MDHYDEWMPPTFNKDLKNHTEHRMLFGVGTKIYIGNIIIESTGKWTIKIIAPKDMGILTEKTLQKILGNR